MNKTFLIFGASMTYGFWDREGGWATRLRKYIDGKNLENIDELDFFCPVFSLGISGDTTEDLLGRFELETQQRILETRDSAFIFSIGVNDSTFVPSKNEQRISPEKFKGNLNKLIGITKKYSQEIVFVGFIPVDESKTIPVSWCYDCVYKNEYLKNYNEMAKDVCVQNGVYFVDIFDEWAASDYKKLLQDGLHPNTDGHKKLFETVKDFLIDKKII